MSVAPDVVDPSLGSTKEEEAAAAVRVHANVHLGVDAHAATSSQRSYSRDHSDFCRSR